MTDIQELMASAANISKTSVDRLCLINIVAALNQCAEEVDCVLPEFADEEDSFCWWGSINGEKAIFEIAGLELITEDAEN